MQDATLEAVEEAGNELDLKIDLDNDRNVKWIAAIRLAENRSEEDILAEIRDHGDEMRREEHAARRLAIVLTRVFTFDGVPDGALVYHGPRA